MESSEVLLTSDARLYLEPKDPAEVDEMEDLKQTQKDKEREANSEMDPKNEKRPGPSLSEATARPERAHST